MLGVLVDFTLIKLLQSILTLGRRGGHQQMSMEEWTLLQLMAVLAES